MSFFRRQPATAIAAGAPFSVTERPDVEALWRLTALPREEFAVTYEAMLARAWSWVSAGVGSEWAAVRRDALANLIAALRARQARILPRFAPAEDAARLTEVMSFALAAVVLAERLGLVIGRAAAAGWCPWAEDVPSSAVLEEVDVPPCYGALLVPRLIGDAGREWVAQEPLVQREMAGYFAQRGELWRIATDAAARLGTTIDAAGTLRRRPDGEVEAAPDPVPATRGAGVGPGAPRVQVDGAPVGVAEPGETAPVVEPMEQGRPEGEAEADPGPGGTGNAAAGCAGPPVIGTAGAGWRWINWVRRGYHDGSIEANAVGSWLHNAAGEAYVVMPACFEEFAAAEGVEWKKVKNQVTRLKRHRLRSSPAGAASTFRAELADGRRVEGMLFPGDLVWDDEGPAAAAVVLRQRGRRR